MVVLHMSVIYDMFLIISYYIFPYCFSRFLNEIRARVSCRAGSQQSLSADTSQGNPCPCPCQTRSSCTHPTAHQARRQSSSLSKWHLHGSTLKLCWRCRCFLSQCRQPDRTGCCSLFEWPPQPSCNTAVFVRLFWFRVQNFIFSCQFSKMFWEK